MSQLRSGCSPAPTMVATLAAAAASLALAFFLAFPVEHADAADHETGREVFVQTCAVCHVTGTANAPRIGRPEEWQARLGAGHAALRQSVLRGKGSMPPKGGNASLSDLQAEAALDYLLSRIGR